MSGVPGGVLGCRTGGGRAVAQDDEDGVTTYRYQAVTGQVAALVAQPGDPERIQGGLGSDGHHRSGSVPAGSSGPGRGVLGGVVEHRVDRYRFQPGVPSASCLCCPGIHLSRSEADVAPEGQDEDADSVMILLRHGARSLVNNNVEDGAHQSQGLLQRDDSGQGSRSHGEDLRGGQRCRGVHRRVDEHGDAQAGHRRDLVARSFRQGSVEIVGRTDAVQ